MARLQIHLGGLLPTGFGFIAWIIALGACAAATVECEKAYNDTPKCSKAYQLEWFSLWLEFFLLVSVTVCSFLHTYNQWRMVLLSFFSMNTVLTIYSAHDFINASTNGKIDFSSRTQEAINAGAAGFVLMSAANFLQMGFLGKDFAYDPVKQGHHHQMSDISTAPAAPVMRV